MKKIFYITLFAAIFTVGALSSCSFNCKKGSGNITTDTRKVEDFSKIKISGAYKVVLKQDSSLSVQVTADDNLQKYIKTAVSGNTLEIKSKKQLCSTGDITVIIGLRQLQDISASGSVKVSTDGKLVAQNLDISVSGSGEVFLDVNAANVHTQGSGSSAFTFKGQATSHTVDLSGSGSVDALDFVVGKYDISTSGSSDCKINVLDVLLVKTSGSSEIQYRGNPGTVKNDESGSSTIKKID
ncbi:MAG: DUF2807 domain-containing protein [Sphingobacteriaceae bacterium]|nr:MAG: DUF2807 domain-containing protein [Sphingobacteriaceae bacterium]